MPKDGKPAASTALPQPANVSQKVPKNSAPRRRGIGIVSMISFPLGAMNSYGTIPTCRDCRYGHQGPERRQHASFRGCCQSRDPPSAFLK